MQICRVLAAYLFQTIAAKEWQRAEKARKHAGIPSKRGIILFMPFQKYILGLIQSSPPRSTTMPHSLAP
jgi:hypothetical protein